MVVVTSFVQPESSIRLLQRNVRAILDKKDLGIGTLYVSESNLGWQEKDDKGFQIDYHSISLHAISKDTNIHNQECIYVLIDSKISLPGYQPEKIEENEESDDESEPAVSELIFVPENPNLLPGIYEAIKTCQELNPDPADLDDDDDPDDHLYEDAEEEMEEEYYGFDDFNHARGDGAVEELVQRMEDNYLNDSNFALRNGNNHGDAEHEDDDEFEDAD